MVYMNAQGLKVEITIHSQTLQQNAKIMTVVVSAYIIFGTVEFHP
jgi:hypothetical protein